MPSAEVLMIGCGLIFAGMAAENFAAHRWVAAGEPSPLDALTVLAVALPAAGLAVMAALAG